MQIDTDELVTLFQIAVGETDTSIQHSKNRDVALYLQGCRDMLHALAKAFKQSNLLAMDLFNIPVTVTEEIK